MTNQIETVKTDPMRVEVHLEGELREFIERRKEQDGIPYMATIRKALTNLKDAEAERERAS